MSHVVLIKPRPGLTPAERRALVAAFDAAVRSIPSVLGVRVGRRVLHGAGYESRQADLADYLIAIDFENMDGLRAYLGHPAHEALGRLFNESLSAAGVYDFEMSGLDGLSRFV